MIKRVLALTTLFLLGIAIGAAQTLPDAPQPAQNIYAAGVAYASGETPGSIPIAANAFEAHLIPAGTNTRTYSFTTFFLVPVKHTNTATNADGTTTTTTQTVFSKDVGVGVAVKTIDIGPYGVYATATGGPSWTGSDTSWQFNYGATMPIRLGKSNYFLFPVLTGISDGTNGTRFQAILDFAWAK